MEVDFPRELEFVFSDGRDLRVIHPQVNQLSMGPSLSVPVPHSVAPASLTRFSLFRESAESYFMSRELRRACSVN